MGLNRGQAAVLVGLTAVMIEHLENSGLDGVRVKELADWLDKPPASVRTSLNQLASEGLATSGRLKLEIKSPGDVDPREKVWKPTYPLNETGMNEMLDDHPEIIDHLRTEEIERLLGVNIKKDDHGLGEETSADPTRSGSEVEVSSGQNEKEVETRSISELAAIAAENPEAVKPVFTELKNLLDHENPEIRKHTLRIIRSLLESQPELISEDIIEKVSEPPQTEHEDSEEILGKFSELLQSEQREKQETDTRTSQEEINPQSSK